jgi:hypothetical protein
MKIRPVWAELFHVDGQRDTRKLRAAFRSFAKAPKKSYISKLNKRLILYSEFVD